MAVDVVVFGVVDGELYVLVHDVNRPPHYKNIKGFPGGIIYHNETAEMALERIFAEKTGLKPVYSEQLYTFSALERDKRNRVVSVAYFACVRPDVVRSYAHTDAHFIPFAEANNLAYDHDEIKKVAKTRLTAKISYTTIAQFLLPRHFTLTDLQTVYETLLGKPIDKRNFRKKILTLGLVKETGAHEAGVQHRPAALYEFTSQKMKEIPLVI